MDPEVPKPAPVGGNRVLVTGATGAIGRLLVPVLLQRGAGVSVLTRHPERAPVLWSGTGAPARGVDCRVADLEDPGTLAPALQDIDCVFHLASYTPPATEIELYEAPGHWRVTAVGTQNLVQAAQETGVGRLVFLSSVKAMGDRLADKGKALDEAARPAPDSLYGRAKLAAERSVLAADTGGMHVCVLRLPMVYGLKGTSNLSRMIAAVARNRFPPWPRIENRRSAVHVSDAIAAMLLAAFHPEAAGRTYLVTDGIGYSTRWLYERVLVALGRTPPAWATPYWVLWSAATLGTVLERLSGRRMPLDREGLAKLTADAWFCSDRIRTELGFEPRYRLDEVIPLMVREYLQGDSKVGVPES